MPRRIGYQITTASSRGDGVPCDFSTDDVDGVEIAMPPLARMDDTVAESINKLLTGYDGGRGRILSLAVTVPPPPASSSVCPSSSPLSPTHVDHAIAQFSEALHSLRHADVGCLSVGIQPPPANGSHAASAVNFDPVSFWYEFLRGIRFDAEAAGVQVAVECRPQTSATSLVGLGDLVDEVACWAVGVCVDATDGQTTVDCQTTADGQAGANCQAAASLSGSLTTLGRRVHCVRLDVGSASLLRSPDRSSIAATNATAATTTTADSATAYHDLVSALSCISRDAIILLPSTADATMVRRLRAIVGQNYPVDGQESRVENHNL